MRTSGRRSLAALLVLVGLALVGFAARADAVPVLWSANGHYYDVVLAPGLTWEQAREAAALQTMSGYEAYLATFTTIDEQQFVGGTFSDALRAPMWLGGYQDAGAVEPDGGWRWISGEPWNTGANAPSYSFNNNAWGLPEGFLITWWGGAGINDYVDNPASYGFGDIAGGYVLEYAPVGTAVPEPASITLLALGAIGVAIRRRMGR